MKALKSLLVIFLVLIIVGGLGYIGWSMFFMPMNHTGMGSMNIPNATASPQQPSNNNQQMPNMPGMNMGQSTTAPSGQSSTNLQSNTLSPIAIQNKDKLNQAIGTINQAMELISIDPYARTTVPNAVNGNMGSDGMGQTQGNGTITIYPSGNSSVNIAPNGNNIPNNAASPANTNQGAVNQQQNTNYVYDQTKLQQLNTGIYTLAQGIMLVNQLNDDLTAQTAVIESNPPTYDNYVARYNTALLNRTKLNNAISMINQASTLVNVNPYGSPNGFQFKVPEMQQLHQGVYKLAQGMTMLTRLSDDFTTQLVQASAQAQALANSNNMMGMNMPGMGDGLFSSISLSTILNIILIIMVIGFLLGIFGAILSMFRRKTNGNDNGSNNPGSESNLL